MTTGACCDLLKLSVNKKGLLPKQHIEYNTKKLLTTIYMFESKETHDSLTTFSRRRWYILNINLNTTYNTCNSDLYFHETITLCNELPSFLLTIHKNILCRNHKIIYQSTHFSYYTFRLLPSQ